MLKITTMATMRNFELANDNFQANILEISNYSQIYTTQGPSYFVTIFYFLSLLHNLEF
jgi:hypothetical protein